jgi:N-acylneuraminate cytidylyltransferase/CMP-N,N'-diacetyllegionaminic acid synthase
MLRGKSIIALIPARSGSKGLPKKNIKIFNGKPLLVWTIEAALSCSFIDKIIVSTDCGETASIAIQAGAEVPFIRPKHLASDTSKSVDVIKHALKFLETNDNRSFDYIILLEPTSPLRESNDIKDAMNKLLDNPESKTLVSVSLTESQNPSFLFNLNSDETISQYEFSQNQILRRQDLKSIYFPEGSVYIAETTFLWETSSFYYEKTLGFIIPKRKSKEIDDIYDFVMCEALMQWENGKR